MVRSPAVQLQQMGLQPDSRFCKKLGPATGYVQLRIHPDDKSKSPRDQRSQTLCHPWELR